MTSLSNTQIVKAIKNPSNGSVMIYNAQRGIDGFEICIKRYTGKELCECSVINGIYASAEEIESFLTELCLGLLEPCHLKDVANDFFGNETE